MDYPDTTTLPADLQEILNSRPANIYRMIAHTPELMPGFLALGDAILSKNSVPATLRELAILRVGHTYRAPYEIHQHERIARAIGLSEPAIAAAKSGPTQTLPGDEAAVLGWVDTLLTSHTFTDTDRADALELFTRTQLVDLVLTVGFYQLVCNFLNTFEVTTAGETF